MNKKYLTTDQDSTIGGGGGGGVGNEKLNILIFGTYIFVSLYFGIFILGVKEFQADFLNVSVGGRKLMPRKLSSHLFI